MWALFTLLTQQDLLISKLNIRLLYLFASKVALSVIETTTATRPKDLEGSISILGEMDASEKTELMFFYLESITQLLWLDV